MLLAHYDASYASHNGIYFVSRKKETHRKHRKLSQVVQVLCAVLVHRCVSRSTNIGAAFFLPDFSAGTGQFRRTNMGAEDARHQNKLSTKDAHRRKSQSSSRAVVVGGQLDIRSVCEEKRPARADIEVLFSLRVTNRILADTNVNTAV